MICVFPSDATDFASNGLCVLTPTACSVTETLNGEWELSMTHPLDERDKWTYLQVGSILRAPVPAAMTPRVSLVSQTTGWSVYTITTKSGKLNLRSGPGTNYKRLGQYAKGKEVVLIAKTNDSWYEVTAPDGKRGYMSTDYLTFARTEGSSTMATGQVVEPRQVRDQPFRIYRVVPTLTQVEVYARHIFYDLMDNMILSYKPEGPVGGTTAAHAVLDRCESAHVGVYVGDGYAVEERGFSYGCVRTKVASRKWTHWFQLPFVDYGDATFTGGSFVKPDTADTEYTLGTRTLKNGSRGTDVKALQEFLLQLGYSLPKYGADGKFGAETETALKTFQKKAGVKQDGIYGSETHAALMDAVADDDEGKADPEPETEVPETEQPSGKQVRIVCGSGSVNIRTGNGTQYSRITAAKDGATFEWVATAENGWHAIVVNGQVGWVSGKYSKTE